MKIDPKVNRDRIIPYTHSTIEGQQFERPQPITTEPEGDQWEIEFIDNSKYKRGQLWYHVKWRGYPLGEDAWQPAENLEGAPQLIKEYHEKHPAAAGPQITIDKWKPRNRRGHS